MRESVNVTVKDLTLKLLKPQTEYLRLTTSDSFELVLASLLLSYLETAEVRKRFLGQVFRVLRPGGCFIMSNLMPNPKFQRVLWKSG
jgi:SAM-dependent methyltransferase